MRKQTKLVAVLSAAALLAIGASMTSFAAQGWQEENGTWVYYNKSGEIETEKWEKSGDTWFWLNEDGEMATDMLVEYSDNYYYVNDNGAMVTNQWVSIENEDYDGDDSDEPANYWYYFQSTGKALKSSANSSNASFKTVNGKKYIFDDEARMLYGWINKEGQRETGDEAWQNGIYYCGDENDGAQANGWKYLDIIDNNYESSGSSEGYSSNNVFDDENQTRYFFFNTNGKKYTDEKGKSINGRKYSFDEYGRMNAEWVIYGATPSVASQASASYTTNWRFYGSPEDGARVTKGWFQVVPDENLNLGDYEDDSTNWYYSDKDGKLVASELKTINGKKYVFDSKGAMKSGLKFIKFDGNSSVDVADILADDNTAVGKFDTEANFKENVNKLLSEGYYCYYFGNDDDGSMKTGSQTITIDGDNFGFLFNKSGSMKGAGKTGIDNSKYYVGGMLLKADKDDKYAVLKITSYNTGDKYSLLTTDEFLDEDFVDVSPKYDTDKYTEHYTVDNEKAAANAVSYKLINTAGSVQKNKSKAKDGNDRCYAQSGEKIVSVFVED